MSERQRKGVSFVSTPTPTPSPKPATESPKQARSMATRERLLTAALDVLRSEGSAAVTTVRLAQDAQIAQSGFYRYFESVDACLQAAVVQASEGVRESIAAARRELFASPDVDTLDAQASHYEVVLSAIAAVPQVAELVVRRRHDRSPAGEAMSALVDAMREDLRRDLVAHSKARGIKAPTSAVTAVADVIAGAVLGAVESMLDAKTSNPKPYAVALAHMALALGASLDQPRR